MKYQQYIINAKEDNIEELIESLTILGVIQMEVIDQKTMDDILKNQDKYGWDYVEEELKVKRMEEPQIKIYFDWEEEIGEELKTFLKRNNARAEMVDDVEWKYTYKDHFKAMNLVPGIKVVPSWDMEKALEKDILLDPGMAFGTGSHETTAMCAKLMEKVGCEKKKILDVGTGSGILAILGARLGGEEILGVDIDKEAIQVAMDNVEKNHVTGQVKIQESDLTKGLDFTADVIVANLVAQLVIVLSRYIKGHLVKGGYFIASGILDEKEEEVVKILEDEGFYIEEVRREGQWCAVCVKYE